MARRRLIAALIAALLLHVATLEWLAGRLQHGTNLQRRADPMFTRLLTPAPPRPTSPAAPVLPQSPRQAPVARATAVVPPPAASSARTTPTVDSPKAAGAESAVASAAATEPAPSGSTTTPAAPASADPGASGTPGADTWPPDTRLTYRLGGQFRGGELYGDARVQWQREQSRYQILVDVDVTLFVRFTMTSQGAVTSGSLVPEAYEEARRGKRRSARFGTDMVELEGGRPAARPPGMQDTASQFVELTHRFATGREKLETGRVVTMWLARPGGVDQWTYEIGEREILKTPSLGEIEAWRLTPRPFTRPRGNITAEMWFSPQLQYLPVRIKLKMGDEAHLDLLVDRIEQR